MVRHEDLSSVALFVIVGIVVGSVMDFVLKYVKIPIPYTVMVFFVGIVYSVSSKAANQPPPKYVNDNTVAADLIIYVFLPALLFNETMNLNW